MRDNRRVPYFKDADELYEFIGALLEELAADDGLTPKFRAADTVMQWRYSNPEAQITASMRKGEAVRIDFGDSDLVPEVVMSLDADLAHRFWLGGVNVAVSMARGQMRTTGPMTKVFRLLPLLKPAHPRYRARLTAAGREDLLLPELTSG